MNMTYEQFYDMTPRSFQNKVKGWEKKERKDWEVARWLGVLIISPHLKKGKQMRPVDLLRFHDEEIVSNAIDLNDKKTRQFINDMAKARGWKLPDDLKN